MVAPAYIEDSYVDHVLSANLDSTYAFEGPEKLLEAWLWPSPDDMPANVNKEGLRAIPLQKWAAILDLVNCKILSMKSSPAVDAYLLSELSLFVFPHKLILKTCGTTTTLACIDAVFEAASAYCLLDGSKLAPRAVHKVFYSRRSFMFPDKQRHVHTDWKREVALLNTHFTKGKLYVVGDFTSDDHWYLYVAGCGTDDTRGHDQTFEILMTQLDPDRAKAFVTVRKPGAQSMVEDSDHEEHDLGHDYGMATMQKTNLDRVFDPAQPVSDLATQVPSPQLSDIDDSDDSGRRGVMDFIHDAFAFAPCGYSSNSVSAGNGGYYYTLHITPESGWSYASFETNYPFSSQSSVDVVTVLTRVLRIFRPGRFSVTFIDDATDSGTAQGELAACEATLSKLGYVKHERVHYDLKNEYSLLYLNFEKN